MKRREFFRQSVPLATLPFMVSGFSLNAYGRSPLLEALVASGDESDRVLVVIQLNGGNDGLNMVIPLDRYSELAAARSNIMISESKALSLGGTTGIHPAMGGLQRMHDDQKLMIVQAVGYPNPNFSHFRATDIWLTGSDSNQTLDTGWMGRFLDDEYPGFPSGYPNTVMPDPLAIQISSVLSPGLQGPSQSMGMAITNPNGSYILPGGADTPPNTPAGHELTFLREVAQQTQQYTTAVKSAASKGANKSSLYPAAGKNSLADQLKIVAQLISGGMKTRIYIVNLGGFDTHSAQVSSTGGTETGAHAVLLGKLSDAIVAFQDDLQLLGVANRVVGMTFSEFGRRIKSNASYGTDHGTAAPLFVFGSNVTGGILGTSPQLPAAATVNDNIPMQYDFRWVYASILQDWFGASPTVIQDVVSTHSQTLPIIGPWGGNGRPLPTDFTLYQNFPNPFNPATTIRYALPHQAHVILEVFNIVGQRVALLVDDDMPAGEHAVAFTSNGLASGTYFYRLRSEGFVETKKFLILK
jgi:uncharacterized protein (DUF1501 family)